MHFNINKLSLICFFACVILAFVIKGIGPTNLILAILSVSTFLFGIFGAHVMANRQDRLEKIRETLRHNDADFVMIYSLSKAFGKTVSGEIQRRIDEYLVKTIDLKLQDYYRSNKEYLTLFEYIRALKPKTKEQEMAYDKMLDLLQEANENRRIVEYQVRNHLLKFEGMTLGGLLGIILFCIFYINDNSAASIIVTILLSTSSIFLLLMIREIDSLAWKEQSWIWDPLQQLFTELDLLPYYPEPIIRSGRVRLEKGTKVRLAYFPHSYPDNSEKEVKIVVI